MNPITGIACCARAASGHAAAAPPSSVMTSRRRRCPSRPVLIASPNLWTRRATFRLTRPTALPRTPLLHVAPHGHLGGPASIDIAGVIDADAFRRAGLDRRLRYEGGDLAVLDAADADAL